MAKLTSTISVPKSKIRARLPTEAEIVYEIVANAMGIEIAKYQYTFSEDSEKNAEEYTNYPDDNGDSEDSDDEEEKEMYRESEMEEMDRFLADPEGTSSDYTTLDVTSEESDRSPSPIIVKEQ